MAKRGSRTGSAPAARSMGSGLTIAEEWAGWIISMLEVPAGFIIQLHEGDGENHYPNARIYCGTSGNLTNERGAKPREGYDYKEIQTDDTKDFLDHS